MVAAVAAKMHGLEYQMWLKQELTVRTQEPEAGLLRLTLSGDIGRDIGRQPASKPEDTGTAAGQIQTMELP